MTSTPKFSSPTGGTGTLDNPTDDFEEIDEYPVIFGVTVTPLIGGIALAFVGVAAAAYILVNMVFPIQEANNKLEADRQQKQAQLDQLKRGEIEEKLLQLDIQIKREKSTLLQILGLFASQKNLDTLLIDINKLIKPPNSAMISFKPDSAGVTTVTDGSFGPQIDGKVRRQGVDLEIEGDFQQVQTIIQNIERLQPLLVVRNLNSEVTEKPKYVFDQDSETISIQGKPKIKTAFRVDAILPLTAEELPKLLEQPKQEEPAKAGETPKN
jgi:hypothetical protein